MGSHARNCDQLEGLIRPAWVVCDARGDLNVPPALLTMRVGASVREVLPTVAYERELTIELAHARLTGPILGASVVSAAHHTIYSLLTAVASLGSSSTL